MLCLGVLVACMEKQYQQIASTSTPVTPRIPITVELYFVEEPPNFVLPEHLTFLWPEPDSIIKTEVYNQYISSSLLKVGIGVKLDTAQVIEPGDIDVDFTDRVNLLVNNEVVSSEYLKTKQGDELSEIYDKDGNFLARAIGPVYFGWAVPLEPGDYQATFQVRQTSGKIIEHSWEFSIVP